MLDAGKDLMSGRPRRSALGHVVLRALPEDKAPASSTRRATSASIRVRGIARAHELALIRKHRRVNVAMNRIQEAGFLCRNDEPHPACGSATPERHASHLGRAYQSAA